MLKTYKKHLRCCAANAAGGDPISRIINGFFYIKYQQNIKKKIILIK